MVVWRFAVLTPSRHTHTHAVWLVPCVAGHAADCRRVLTRLAYVWRRCSVPCSYPHITHARMPFGWCRVSLAARLIATVCSHGGLMCGGVAVCRAHTLTSHARAHAVWLVPCASAFADDCHRVLTQLARVRWRGTLPCLHPRITHTRMPVGWCCVSLAVRLVATVCSRSWLV